MNLSMFVYLLQCCRSGGFEDAIPHADALREQLNSIYLILFCDALVFQCSVKERLKQEILEQKIGNCRS